MQDFQIFTIVGRLTRDPEYRTFSNGGGVCNFSIASNNSKKNAASGSYEDVPVFVDCAAFDRGTNKMGERLSQWFKKGSRILISGRLVQETWDDKSTGQKRTKLKLSVDDFVAFEKLGHKSSDAPQSAGDYQSDHGSGDDQGSGDEIPF